MLNNVEGNGRLEPSKLRKAIALTKRKPNAVKIINLLVFFLSIFGSVIYNNL